MNRDNKIAIIVTLAVLLCCTLVTGVHYLDGYLKELQAEADDLDQRIVNAQADMESLIAQKRVFNEVLGKLNNDSYHVKPTRDETEFYAALQQAADNNQVKVLSTRQGGNQDGVTTMTLNLEGEYYNALQVLAAWRDLPITVRVDTLTIRQAKGTSSGEENHIALEVVVETILGTQTNAK